MRGKILAVVCATVVGTLFGSCNTYFLNFPRAILREIVSYNLDGPIPVWGEYTLMITGGYMLNAFVTVLAYLLFARVFIKQNAVK